MAMFSMKEPFDLAAFLSQKADPRQRRARNGRLPPRQDATDEGDPGTDADAADTADTLRAAGAPD